MDNWKGQLIFFVIVAGGSFWLGYSGKGKEWWLRIKELVKNRGKRS